MNGSTATAISVWPRPVQLAATAQSLQSTWWQTECCRPRRWSSRWLFHCRALRKLDDALHTMWFFIVRATIPHLVRFPRLWAWALPPKATLRIRYRNGSIDLVAFQTLFRTPRDPAKPARR